MAAAALLRSMVTKLACAPPPPPRLRPLLALRAPPQPRHRHILNRGLHSSTTAPPTSDKDKIIEDLRLRLWFARASAGIGGFMLTGITIYGYFWLLPEVEKERERLERLKPEDERPPSVSLARIIAREGYRKQQSRAEKGTTVDLMEVCFDILKETTAGLKECQADLKESRVAIGRIAKLAPSNQKEGCSRVGSETVAC